VGTSSKRKVLDSFSWLLAEKFSSLGSAFLVGIILARSLGPGDYGLLSYILAWAVVIAPFSGLGLNHILTTEFITRPENEGLVLGTSFVLSTLGSILATGLMAGYLYLVPQDHPQVSWLILLLTAATCLSSLESLQYWFVAKGLASTYALSRMVVSMTFVAIRIVMVYLGFGLIAFVLIAAVETVAAAIRNYTAYRLVRLSPNKWKWDFGLARSLLSRAWPMIIGGLTGAVYLRIDTIMLANWRPSAEVGIYAIAARLSELIYFVPPLLMAAAFPALLRVRNRDKAVYVARLQTLLDLMIAAGMLTAAAWCLFGPIFIPLVFGNAYSAAVSVLMVHAWAAVFICGRAVFSKWVIAEGHFLFSAITQGIAAGTNILVNIILIPRYGAVGAAFATLIGAATALAHFFG
jgi:O-antigen/teichoic acid export membrane protein